jgi:hypothetical protein
VGELLGWIEGRSAELQGWVSVEERSEMVGGGNWEVDGEVFTRGGVWPGVNKVDELIYSTSQLVREL